MVGAGAGLSTSAGLAYSGPRFQEHFADFIQKYGFRDMYSAGFYPFPTLEQKWAYWSRHIYWNRYERPVGAPYRLLLDLVRGRDFFVLTTNVDHLFQDAGFDKQRFFYTQGDYGLWQCSEPCCQKTYDNEEAVRRMVAEQRDLRIPTELVPRCPVCGKPMTMNLRSDHTFVEDEGWFAAEKRWSSFLLDHRDSRILYLELGVGGNTPSIIKYPFWRSTLENPRAFYVCVNQGETFAPRELEGRSLCLDGDIGAVLAHLAAGVDRP